MAPPRTILNGLSPRRFGVHVSNVLFGLILSLFAAGMVYSEEVPQDWVPQVLVLPEDAEVELDRAIGANIRMFSFSTGADLETLFGDWSAALEEDGYDIRPQQADLDEKVIEFSGRDILNAKIGAEATTGNDRTVITFDVTLR